VADFGLMSRSGFAVMVHGPWTIVLNNSVEAGGFSIHIIPKINPKKKAAYQPINFGNK
jgi:hypothetical protein